MAQIFNTVSIVGFILSAVFLALSIFLFIKLNIPKIIGDLSGRTARKSIAQMREDNEKSGDKSYRPHPVAVNRGTLTEPIKEEAKQKKKKTAKKQPAPSKAKATAKKAADITAQLPNDGNETTPLSFNMNGTEVLSEGTQVLSSDAIQSALEQKSVEVKMLQSIVFLHTDEVI